MEKSPIFKTLVMTDAVPGHLLLCDTILWDERYWIVPEWLEDQTTGKRQPERIILLDNLKHTVAAPGSEHHFLLNDPIPKHVFSGQPQGGTSYLVIICPPIFLDTLPPLLH